MDNFHVGRQNHYVLKVKSLSNCVTPKTQNHGSLHWWKGNDISKRIGTTVFDQGGYTPTACKKRPVKYQGFFSRGGIWEIDKSGKDKYGDQLATRTVGNTPKGRNL